MARTSIERKTESKVPTLQLTVADWAEVKKETSPASKRNKQQDIVRAKVRNLAFGSKEAIKAKEAKQGVSRSERRRRNTKTSTADLKEPEKTKPLKRKAEEAEDSQGHDARRSQRTAIAREAARRSMSNSGATREG